MRNMGWSVGDGNSIKAWHDPWLSTSQQHHGLLGEIWTARNKLVFNDRRLRRQEVLKLTKAILAAKRMADGRKQIVIMSNHREEKHTHQGLVVQTDAVGTRFLTMQGRWDGFSKQKGGNRELRLV
ncbi:hypothetical protein Rs2_46108 [Raphanus sativus]|nr:hypothetical protein Rs2_46108 [Raphanus sativus]